MSNQREYAQYNQARRSQMSRQLTLQYILVLLSFLAGFLLLFFLAWRFFKMFIWQPDDILYQLFKIIQETVLLWGIPLILIGWTVITYHFFQKPLRYLDEVVIAAEQLTVPSETPILLPEAMANVQTELNLVREQALRNAMAAREAEQRKNDLIVYLAHDLKTPLTSVIGYLTLLHDEKEISPDLRAKYIGISLDKALRLEDLINEFFDITRFSLTHLVLEPERINLTRLLEQTTFEFNPVLADKGLTWDLQLEPDIEIVCDPDKMARVFDNLIRNAVSYSYSQSTIRVSLTRIGGQVTVMVQNHGKTIPPEKLSKIFEQFFRLDSSRSSATGGAGLGLAIAKEIVELHGGTITADSADESNLFTVHLLTNYQKIV